MKTTTFKLPSQPKEKLLSIYSFEGIDLSKSPTEISDYASPDMLNFSIENGALVKRTGWTKCYPTALIGKVNKIFDYIKSDGTIMHLMACGTGLYSWIEGVQPTLLYGSLAGDITTFVMNSKLYILDGTQFLQYDGATFTDVLSIAYIPTLFVVCDASSGSGKALEQWNLLGRGFKQSYSADGTSTVYKLCLAGLDTDIVQAWINGTVKTEGTDFTVDRTNGKVTFTTAPAKGTDNVVIQAYKNKSDFHTRIKKCTLYALYGGLNDTRVVLSGNADSKSVIFRSGIYDPTYFPENTYQSVGANNEAITGLVLNYDCLIVLKEYSIWSMSFELNSDGTAVYPVRPLNDSTGCIAPKSVQLLDNAVVFLDRKGLFMLTQSTVRTEKNVELISDKVNSKLLNEDLKSAVSIDYEGKYYLCIGSNLYIMDYRNVDRQSKYIWCIWSNIPATCFCDRNTLYFGSSNGYIYRFKNSKDTLPYNDEGHFINAYWKSAKISFGIPERNKLIQKLFATIEPYKHTSCNFYYVSDMVSFPRNASNLPDYSIMDYGKSFYNDKIFDAKSEFIDSTRTEWLDYDTLNYSLFSYNTSEEPCETVMKVKAKKVIYYQFIVQNTKLDEGLTIDELTLKYIIQNYRK